MSDAATIQDTLLHLVPGFIALKAFYIVGFQTRRTDLELTLWSLVVAAFINAVFGVVAPDIEASRRVIVEMLAGLALGLLAALAWLELVKRRPNVQSSVVITSRAWDDVFALTPTRWMQIWLTDGRVVMGWPGDVAIAQLSDSLDLYLREPQWVDPVTGARTPMTGVEGLLILESSISFVQVESPVAQ